MSRMLDDHGTTLSVLKPSSIVAAAAADIRKAERKAARQADRFEPYCFHRRHVRKAEGARELIALAADDRARGISSGKRITRLIYGDAELLAAALRMVRGTTTFSTSNEGEKIDMGSAA